MQAHKWPDDTWPFLLTPAMTPAGTLTDTGTGYAQPAGNSVGTIVLFAYGKA